MRKLFITFCLLTYCTISFVLNAQENLYNSQGKLMQIVNPSFFGLNSWNKAGLMYNTVSINSNESINNKFFYGSYSFDLLNFSLGVSFNNFTADNAGLNKNDFELSYIYKIQIGNDSYLLPGISAGFESRSINPKGLIFEDQINSITGYINQESIDPVADFFLANSNFDLGASFIFHNENFLAGLTFQHLNRPNISYTTDVEFTQPLTYGFQLAYEFDMNPYDRRFLPRYSYLYSYGSIIMTANSMNIFLSQEFQLGEFSVGLHEQFGNLTGFNLLNLGISAGLSYENFDFGVSYSFATRDTQNLVYSPSIFDLHLSFDFSPFLRNRRGQYKRLLVNNYY